MDEYELTPGIQEIDLTDCRPPNFSAALRPSHELHPFRRCAKIR